MGVGPALHGAKKAAHGRRHRRRRYSGDGEFGYKRRAILAQSSALSPQTYEEAKSGSCLLLRAALAKLRVVRRSPIDGAMGGALSRASRIVRAGPPPSAFPAPPRVPKRAAPAVVSEMEQARSIEATLNHSEKVATISSSTVISHGAAPTGMAQRNALVGELDPLQL